MTKVRFALLSLMLCLIIGLAGRVTHGSKTQIQAAATNLSFVQVLSGLSNPLLVTHAHDGSNRIFIIEQTGMIKVVQPGSTTPTVFLDLTSKITCCGEQGVLGLAFHPQFWNNKRFFVDYARSGDGATVISEFHVSSGDPNVGDANSERILLTVPQPFSNHNGGMIEFGPDGLLYISKGDGGSANDPNNRAQNTADLHGKILRIDVDHTSGALQYAIPATNPFFGSTTAAQEIYSLGMRNPWRFSFDRGTGKLYCGDVGQGAWEEADIITLGSNYGWRIWEGNHCTNIDPCVSTGMTFPILEYGHASGRCAIIGGYVYRGTLATLAQGLYLYGDLCTGEVWTFDGSTQTLLLSTGKSPHSFGEDESGEIYMADGGGGIYKLEGTPSCSFSLDKQSASFGMSGATASVQVTDTGGCNWSSMSNASWITINSGGSGSASGTLNYTVAPNTGGSRLGTISVAGTVFKITQSGAPSFVGYLDHAGCDFIGGWAADRNQLNTPITVSLYDGTTLLTTVTASASRPDVGGFLGDTGMHGYTIPIPASLKDGNPHSVHVRFEMGTADLTNSPASLNCSVSSVSYVGFVDHAGCDNITGWAADRNRSNTPINIQVYDGSTLIGVFAASASRPDVGAFLGDNGMHGFSITTPGQLRDGSMHSVHVKFEASTTELSSSPASLNCTSFSPNYVGFVDHIACDFIGGWVADRNRLNTPITVSIYANNVLIAMVQADGLRTDVGTFLVDNGRHGFNLATPASLKGGKTTVINVRFEDSTMDLFNNSPFTLTCP